jgi:LEA14-like dessication related protein
MRSTILLAVACSQALGCSMFLRSMERPEVQVRDVSVQAAGLAGVSGELRLDVTNPNNFGVPLSGIDWQLALGGARAATGRVTLSQTIPARGVAPISTSLTIDARDALAVASALARGARGYQVTAVVHFSTAVGSLDVDVQHSGTLAGAGSWLGVSDRGPGSP